MSNRGITKEIQKMLDAGIRVFSGAVGRVGEIVETEGNAVRIKLHRKCMGATHGVTTFESGDPVKLEYKWDRWNVVNIWGDEFNAET